MNRRIPKIKTATVKNKTPTSRTATISASSSGMQESTVLPPLIKNIRELSVGEVAKRSGVPISTIHFYERKKLITSRRNSGNQRRYTRDVLRFVAIIKVAQRAGIPLVDIKHALASLPNGRTPNKQDWQQLTRSWHAMLQERIHALTQLRDQFQSCIGCGCLSLLECPLRNPEDVLSKEGAGPRLLLER